MMLDALMNEKAKIKKAHSERLEKKKKKRGGSLNIKRSSSFFDRFRRSRSHEAPKTPFTVMYDCEKDEDVPKFRQRRHVGILLRSCAVVTIECDSDSRR